MRPDAWIFECCLADCGGRHRRSYGDRETLRVEGDRATAIRRARALGWVPCSEINGGRKNTTAWWCPACTSYVRGLSVEASVPASSR